jgi:hypothetical protein
VRSTIASALVQSGFRLSSARDLNLMTVNTADAIVSEIVSADLIVAVDPYSSTSVSYELGIAQAASKPLLVIVGDVAPDRSALLYPAHHIRYAAGSQEGLDSLRQEITKALLDFRRNANRFRPSTRSIIRPATPPSVDLDHLHPRDAENLCFELLTQMGFRRIEWDVSLKEFDVIATLPKKDPDGFEYNELWLISIGMNSRGGLPEILMRDPEFALHRLEMERLPIDLKTDVPVTFLFIQTRESPSLDRVHQDLLRMELRSRSRRIPPIRTRVWDRQQLVRLIQEHPQIWQKYFSEDGRVRSTTRKSYEALYIELSDLNEKLQATIRALEEEREKRARAERDAVWKDVAFTAAHKLGNPIFALETSLQAVKRRISGRLPEVYEIVVEMESSIEKAKLIIDQFKSLTRANEIELRPLDLPPRCFRWAR